MSVLSLPILALVSSLTGCKGPATEVPEPDPSPLLDVAADSSMLTTVNCS